VTVQRTILFHDVATLKTQRQLVGTNDEVIDLRFAGPNESRLAVATTSEQVRQVAEARGKVSHREITHVHALPLDGGGADPAVRPGHAELPADRRPHRRCALLGRQRRRCVRIQAHGL